MTAAPDRSLERYEIVDRIAVGGMAEVFRAKAFGAHGFEKTLAIKRILPDLANDPEFEQRFIQEAKLAVQLAHANIVQVFDFGRFGGTLFIAMEFVDGLDLAALIRELKRRGEQIPVSAGLHIGVELFKGLDYAHQRGVVHRDVSPSNILLSRSGEVKIADFGIAQAEVERTKADTQRRIMGKWRYMSPEQAQGESLDAQSDLFSAGAVMHEVFTTDKLFPGDDAEQVLANIRSMPIPKVSELRNALPPRLDEVLAQLLERAAGDRPRRAAEVQRALTEISYDSSIVSTALDVADVVASVLGVHEAEAVSMGGARRGIDDLIRQQIGGDGEDVGRQPTEVDVDRQTEEASLRHTQTTFVRKGVDPDGVTMWEVETQTIAAVPSAIRGERSGAIRAGDDEPADEAADADEAAGRAHRRGGLRWIAAAAVVAVGAAAGIYALGGGASRDEPGAIAYSAADGGGASAVLADAAPASATLRIVSMPEAARVEIDGVAQADVTPLTAVVSPEELHTVAFIAPGYRRLEKTVTVGVGETLLVSERLERQQGMLTVRTKPPGARVVLAGELVGETPLVDWPVVPATGISLVLEKDDYKPLRLSVDIIDGQREEIVRTLQSALAYGKIDIAIEGSWAYVYFKNKRLGRAPNRGFELPVGTQSIRLENPVTGKTKTVTVEVFADRVEFYKLSL